MAIHHLKIHPEPFRAQVDGRKAYEVRLDDRGFAEGDLLVLEEWDPASERFTGASVQRLVTTITRGYGLLPGFVILGTAPSKGVALSGFFAQGKCSEVMQSLGMHLQ